MPELGKAYVQIVPSAKGMAGNLEKEIGGEQIGNSVGGKIGKTMVAAFAAQQIGKLIKASVMEGADLQQNLGGTEAVFGKFADSLQTKASSAYKNMGLSASEYMATANKMGSLFQGSGVSQQKSLDMTSDAMQRAADVASVMGVDTNTAMESIAGAAKGNFTMMDNLGVAMNATTLKAYALEKGINFDWNTASNAEKSELAMKMFMDRTSQYAGNFAKESETTISGSMGAVKAAWSDFLGNLSLGKDIGPSLTALSGTVVGAAKNLVPAIINVVATLPGALLTVLANIAPQIGPFIAQTIIDLCNLLVQQIPVILVAAGQIISGLITGLLQAIPMLIAAIPQIITGLITGLLSAIPQIIQCGIDLLMGLVGALPQIIQSICDMLPQIITGIVTGLLSNIPQIIEAGIQLFVALIKALPQIIVTLVKAMPQIIVALVKGLGEGIGQFVKIGGDLIKGLWQGIIDFKDWLWDKITGFFGGIVDGIKDFLGINSPSKVFAEMGKFMDKGLAKGIYDSAYEVERAMDNLAELTTGNLESEMMIKARASVPPVPDEEIEAGKGIIFTQNIIIEQPVKSAAETARTIREEAIKMGLAGV